MTHQIARLVVQRRLYSHNMANNIYLIKLIIIS
jgi:hypothetical protein